MLTKYGFTTGRKGRKAARLPSCGSHPTNCPEATINDHIGHPSRNPAQTGDRNHQRPAFNATDLAKSAQQVAVTAGTGLGALALIAFLTASNPGTSEVTLGAMSAIAFLAAGLLELKLYLSSQRYNGGRSETARRFLRTHFKHASPGGEMSSADDEFRAG